MNKVFVSSVVGGMEQFRQIAKQAIQTMAYTPVMCEDFSARPYSSEQACFHEVEQSDIYLVIVGSDYGHETPKGISVTQAEFKRAKAANKPILAFFQQVDARDERQQTFLSEIEAYQSGVFRTSFSSVLELNNEIIKALRQIETMSQAIPESTFKARVANVLKDRQSYQEEPELIMAFLPQPERMVDIVSIEQNMNHLFSLLCEANVTKFCDGYELLDHARWSGFSSGKHSVYFCADSLIMLTCNFILSNDGIYIAKFAPPDQIARTATGLWHIIHAPSGFVHMAMHQMENTYVADPPRNTYLKKRISGDNCAEFSRHFMPLTEGNYIGWVEQCIKRLSRIFKLKN